QILPDGDLMQVADRPAPGVGGVKIVADPTGQGVCYVARGGSLTEMMMPSRQLVSVHPENLRTVHAAYRAGINVSDFCYNPRRPEAYTYNGSVVTRYPADGGKSLGHIDLPDGIKREEVSWIACSPDGRDVLVAYEGKPGGIFISRLPPQSAEEKAKDE